MRKLDSEEAETALLVVEIPKLQGLLKQQNGKLLKH
jgi:hypothetical protein